MLSALKQELKRLAVDPEDPFLRKIRARVGKRATGVLESRLRQFILLMPGMVHQIRKKWSRENDGAEIKRLGSFVMAYLYNPRDFLAEEEHGLFGYLDDAYLVAEVYERVVSRSAAVEDEDNAYMKTILKTKRYVQAVIPEECRLIEEMVETALKRSRFDKFAAAFKGAA